MRMYYIKVETMARLMKDYIIEYTNMETIQWQSKYSLIYTISEKACLFSSIVC